MKEAFSEIQKEDCFFFRWWRMEKYFRLELLLLRYKRTRRDWYRKFCRWRRKINCALARLTLFLITDWKLLEYSAEFDFPKLNSKIVHFKILFVVRTIKMPQMKEKEHEKNVSLDICINSIKRKMCDETLVTGILISILHCRIFYVHVKMFQNCCES